MLGISFPVLVLIALALVFDFLNGFHNSSNVSAIMGVGAAERVSQVRRGVAGQNLTAWLTTIPFSAVVAAGLAAVLRRWL